MMNENKKQDATRGLVEREVSHCCSSLIHHFANNPESLEGSDYSQDDIISLCSGDDWETPAMEWIDNHDDEDEVIEAAIFMDLNVNGVEDARNQLKEWCEGDIETCRELCENIREEPHQIEALEHWIVSSWFAGKLEAKGELVGEIFDFHVWGRRTSGQAILLDGVMNEIANELGLFDNDTLSSR